MNECFKCGVSGDKVKLSNAISSKGIVKVCDDCASAENLPVIKKPVDIQSIDSQRQKSVRDRLTGMNKKFSSEREVSLRDLVDQKFKNRTVQSNPDLADNFHWVIQRIRRARKITREEFAKGINEPESTVRMIEQGVLPENNYKIITKIEEYLKINLRKPGSSGFSDTTPSRKFVLDDSLTGKEQPKKFSLDRETTKQLKISDLREIKKKQEKEILNKPVDSWEEEYSQDDEQFLDEPEEFEEEE